MNETFGIGQWNVVIVPCRPLHNNNDNNNVLHLNMEGIKAIYKSYL